MIKKKFYLKRNINTKLLISLQCIIYTRQPFAGSSKTKYGLKVRKIGVQKECGDKTYLDINDTEMNFINKLVDETNMDFWSKIYTHANGPRFLVPNLLAKTKYAYLVEEVKNED